MPIGSLISQPNANSINAAYRPVIARVSATRTDNMQRPPVVYCDVYFNDVYYKTISKSQYTVLGDADTEWQFDIQDAAQEYLKKYIGENGDSSIAEVTTTIVKAFCRFRSSGFDSNGFITPEGVVPIQGYSENDPVPGNGFESNAFYILNATLKHEDNQDVATHLASFRYRTWAANTWPLTHRPEYYQVGRNHSDVFPIVHDGNALSCLRINYQNKGQSSWATATTCALESCPIPLNVEITVLDNGDDTQAFTFNWSAVSSPTAQLDIQSRVSGSSDPWTSHIGSIVPTRSFSLPIGLYDFRVAGVGDCNTKPSVPFEGYGIPVCIPVQIVSAAANMPNGQVGIPYNYTVYLSGSAPFALANITKPAWMTISVVGSTIVFSGTPTDAGLAVPVEYDITNCSGGGTQSISTEIDIASASPSSLKNNSAISFAYKIRINGTFYAVGTIAPGATVLFSAPELGFDEGYELYVYTSALLMTTCSAESNSVNIPMIIDLHGPGTNNQASNLAGFAIVNGVQIKVS